MSKKKTYLTNDDRRFIEWENNVFGCGYGTGDEHTLTALVEFMSLCSREIYSDDVSFLSYDYRVLEKELTPTVAWLMINILVNADVIEYGTSPRHGWLTKKGEEIHEYVGRKSLKNLIAMIIHN